MKSWRTTMSPAVARNLLAHETVTQVACPHCGQAAGFTCVTTGNREAAFPHATRIHLRWEQIGDAR